MDHTHVHGESNNALWHCATLQAPNIKTAVAVTELALEKNTEN